MNITNKQIISYYTLFYIDCETLNDTIVLKDNIPTLKTLYFCVKSQENVTAKLDVEVYCTLRIGIYYLYFLLNYIKAKAILCKNLNKEVTLIYSKDMLAYTGFVTTLVFYNGGKQETRLTRLVNAVVITLLLMR